MVGTPPFGSVCVAPLQTNGVLYAVDTILTGDPFSLEVGILYNNNVEVGKALKAPHLTVDWYSLPHTSGIHHQGLPAAQPSVTFRSPVLNCTTTSENGVRGMVSSDPQASDRYRCRV